MTFFPVLQIIFLINILETGLCKCDLILFYFVYNISFQYVFLTWSCDNQFHILVQIFIITIMMMIPSMISNIFVILCCVWSLSSVGLECYRCYYASDPSLCRHHVTCKDGEVSQLNIRRRGYMHFINCKPICDCNPNVKKATILLSAFTVV